MRERHHMLPVWFFIGLLLTIYGIIILITSIVDWSEPSQANLAQYHPAFGAASFFYSSAASTCSSFARAACP